MTHIRKLALALFLGLLCSSYSNSQSIDPATGNLINYGTSPTETTSTWNNGVYVNQLCFGYGDPGNCGPNPSIREGNNINFSFGTVDLNQIVNINKALSIGGSGVQLSGFNFGFMAKNGNGWDDGRQDYLSAYVKFYNSAGSLASTYDYTDQTNRRYNWTLFNFSETFASPVLASTYSNAQVGFVGRDNNFWAGTYGPEIYNVNFSLKYSVRPDPCIADPLSSPTCPGYALATVKNSILGSTVSNASVTSFVPVPNYALVSSGPGTGPAMTSIDFTNPVPQQQGPGAGPQGLQGPMGPQGLAAGSQGQDPNQNPSGSTDSPSQPGPAAGPAPGGGPPQQAGGPPQTAQSAPPSSSGPNQAGPSRSNDGPKMTPGAALSVARAAQEKDKAVQATAVQNAAKAFENVVQISNTTSNAAVSMNQDMSANSATAAAQFFSQSTQTSQQTSVQSSQGSQQQQQSSTQQQQGSRVVQQVQQQQETQQVQNQSSTNLVQVLPPKQQEIQQAPATNYNTQSAQTAQSTYSTTTIPQQETPTAVAMLKPTPPPQVELQSQVNLGTGLTVNRTPFAYNPLNVMNSNTGVQPTQPDTSYQPKLQERIIEVEAPPIQTASFGGPSRSGNPLNDLIQSRIDLPQTNIDQRADTVKKNVQPNDLAGGVDVAAMAQIPKGYEVYSIVTLRDAPFYKPETIYKNNRTVDNARVLRGLTGGSDAKHQQMVDQQYK
jgi:hypothetical protein